VVALYMVQGGHVKGVDEDQGSTGDCPSIKRIIL